MSLEDASHPNTRARGRPFPKGNGGRRVGSKNRATLVAEALLKGEEAELVRKAIDLAKAGDVPMLKFLLDRILPKERSVQLDLPAIDADISAVEACGRIVAAAASGRISPSEAAVLASLLTIYTRIQDIAEFGERLEKVENTFRAMKGA
jgi:hypothetical protein